MPGKKTTMQIHSMIRAAKTKPETFNNEDNTVDVVFSSGARIKRNTFFGWGEDFWEELAISRKAVRLDRLNAGAAVLDTHDGSELSRQIGSILSAKISGGLATAKLQLTRAESKQELVNDIKDGIIRNISVGYRVHDFDELEPEEDGLRIFRATDWEPYEVSFVPVPADAGAQVRSNGQTNPCNIYFRGENEMPTGKTDPGASGNGQGAQRTDPKPEPARTDPAPNPAPAEPKIDPDKIRVEAVEAERKRATDIAAAVKSVGLDDEFSRELVDSGATVEDANKRILEKIAKKDTETHTDGNRVEIVSGEAETRRDGLTEALLHRSNPSRHELTDKGRIYRRMGLSDMVRFCLEASGERTWGMGKDEMARKAFELHLRGGLHSTSDFPLILADVINKTLRAEYEQTPRTFTPFVRPVTASDFKEISRTQLGDAPELELLPENGEIKYGTIGEGAEKYALETYAKGIRVGRKAIVNDDLDAFTRFPMKFGQRASEKESDLVYFVMLANAALSDAVALFHATHNNLNYGAGAAAMDEDTLSDMRTGMRKQKGLDGLRVTIRPAHLLVPPELETDAGKITSSAFVPGTTDDINQFSFLTPIVEQRLSDTDFHASATATAHYLTASAGQADIIELAKLEGEEGPVIETEDMFDVEGMKLKARIDLGCKAIDYRGLQKNDGA